MKLPSADPGAVQRFSELTPTGPGITVKKVFGQPAAFINGNMFFGVFGPNLFLRLSAEQREEASRSFRAQPFEPMKGRPMTEYICLPTGILGDKALARTWVERGLAHASALAPKGSPRKQGISRDRSNRS